MHHRTDEEVLWWHFKGEWRAIKKKVCLLSVADFHRVCRRAQLINGQAYTALLELGYIGVNGKAGIPGYIADHVPREGEPISGLPVTYQHVQITLTLPKVHYYYRMDRGRLQKDIPQLSESWETFPELPQDEK